MNQKIDYMKQTAYTVFEERVVSAEMGQQPGSAQMESMGQAQQLGMTKAEAYFTCVIIEMI